MKDLKLRDRKILKLLDQDARLSNSQIAKKLRVNKNVVNYNIKRLEELGVIKGYNAMIDYSSLGYIQFEVYIDLYERNVEINQQLVKHLLDMKQIGLVVKVIGDWDVVVGFYVKTPQEFREVWHKVLQEFKPQIKKYQINLVAEKVMFPRSYLDNKKKNTNELEWHLGNHHSRELDETDMKILHLLAKDARTPIKDIALKTKMSSMAIIYRLKQLVKKEVIEGYRVNLKFAKLGLQHFHVNMDLENPKVVKKMTEFCKVNPFIIKVDKSIGEFDFEFDLEVENFDQFLQVIDEMKTLFPGAIRDYKYVRFLEYNKRNYLPC
jgi:Lrp/AsnC family transcriptional regulator, leucine-responsive regulatory protein